MQLDSLLLLLQISFISLAGRSLPAALRARVDARVRVDPPDDEQRRATLAWAAQTAVPPALAAHTRLAVCL